MLERHHYKGMNIYKKNAPIQPFSAGHVRTVMVAGKRKKRGLLISLLCLYKVRGLPQIFLSRFIALL